MDQATKNQGNAQVQNTGVLLGQASNDHAAAVAKKDWKAAEAVFAKDGPQDRAGKSNEAMADLWDAQPVDGSKSPPPGGGEVVDVGGGEASELDGTGDIPVSDLSGGDKQLLYVHSVSGGYGLPAEEGVHRRVLDATAQEITNVRNDAATGNLGPAPDGMSSWPNINEYKASEEVTGKVPVNQNVVDAVCAP